MTEQEVIAIAAQHIPEHAPAAHKVAAVESLRQQLADTGSFILTDYRGLTVGEKQALTRQVVEAGAKYTVVKNRLFKLALGDRADEFAAALTGPTAILFFEGDPVTPTKALYSFMKEREKVVVKAGLIDGDYYAPEAIEALSKLPGREELLGQVVAAIGSPLSGLVYTLQGVFSSLVWTLKAVADERQTAAA